jgi:hypothetical protein
MSKTSDHQLMKKPITCHNHSKENENIIYISGYKKFWNKCKMAFSVIFY